MRPYQLRNSVAWGFLLLAIMNLQPEVSQTFAEESSTSRDLVPVVIMAPNGPVMLHLDVQVSGVSWRFWIADYLATVLDQDRDNQLSEAEQKLLPDEIRVLLSPETAVTSDGMITRAEFAKRLQQSLPQIPQLIAPLETADQSLQLFSILDADFSGTLTPEELQNAPYSLRFRDLDDDETFSASELSTYRDPLSTADRISPEALNLPFHHLIDHDSRRDAAKRIVSRYGNGKTVDASVFRMPPPDVDDGDLNTAQLAERFATIPPHIEAEIQISDLASRSSVTATVRPTAAAFCRIADSESDAVLLLRTDGMQLQLQARGGGSNNRMITRGFLGQEFMMNDGDRSQTLSEVEFAAMQRALTRAGIPASFGSADTDADMQISRNELFGFADRQMAVVAGRLEFSVEQSGRTLFGLLDTNPDFRLSRREFQSAAKALKKIDENGDNVISDAEMGTEYVVTIGLGRSELRRQQPPESMMSMSGPGEAIVPDASELRGPDWFRAMDRNRDGDVSPREFPGSKALFNKIDHDRNGLLDSEEADLLEFPE